MRNYRTFVSPIVALGIAASVSFGAQESDAATVTNAVYLGIDSSGSISRSDFALQRDAYEFLLGATPTDGSRALGFLQFSSSVQEVFPLRQINSDADVAALTSAISGLTQLSGLTDLSGAIDVGASAITSSSDFDCTSADVKCAIDISTDGVQTVSGNPDSSADAAVAAGVDQVNCLGVGASFDCSFIEGEDSFFLAAESFEDFRGALGQKLLLEGAIDELPAGVDPVADATVPLPASALFLIAGLGGLGVASRRRKAA